tara:strand:- start:323 stop:1654 length:1332 start_codon:yes stop_codon:yes gene_type:complete
MKLTDNFFSLFQRDVFLFFSTLLTHIIIARKLGPEMIGLWTILLLIPGYSEAFGRLRFEIVAIYFLGKKKTNVGEITFLLHMATILSTLLLVSTFTLGFDWFYAKLFKNTEIDVRWLAYTMLLIFPLRSLYYNYSYILIAQENVRLYNTIVLVQALSVSVISVILLLIFQMGIVGALIGLVSGLTISILYGAYKVQKIDKINPNLNLKLLWEMSKYASHQYSAGLLGYFQISVTNLISAIYLPPAQIAFFALGKSLCEIATRMVPNAINTILYPRVSKTENFADSAILVARLFRITLLILVVSASVLTIFIKAVVFLLFGTAYYPIIVPYLIIIYTVVLGQSGTVFTSYFSGRGRPDLLSKILILPLIVQIGLALVLIPQLGVNGAAFSFALSTILLFGLHGFYFLRLSGLSLKDLVIRHDDMATILNFISSKYTTLTRVFLK